MPTSSFPAGSGTIGGTIQANQVATGSGADTLSGAAGLTFDGTTLTGTAVASSTTVVSGTTVTVGTYVAGAEQVAPAAPAANGYRMFAQDNGGGKTQLMVIFASGAAQQLAIQP